MQEVAFLVKKKIQANQRFMRIWKFYQVVIYHVQEASAINRIAPHNLGQVIKCIKMSKPLNLRLKPKYAAIQFL